MFCYKYFSNADLSADDSFQDPDFMSELEKSDGELENKVFDLEENLLNTSNNFNNENLKDTEENYNSKIRQLRRNTGQFYRTKQGKTVQA